MTAQLALLHLVCCSLLSANTYCSLLVNVVDGRNKEVSEALITVPDTHGQVSTYECRRGGLRLCDLGIEPVTVAAGSSECNQTTVKNVPLDWGETRIVKIIYDRRPCLLDLPPVAACRLLLRFRDVSGRWVKGVAVDSTAAGGRVQTSDDYGRLLLTPAAGARIRSLARRTGYTPEEIDFSCAPDVMRGERLVTLSAVP